MVEETVKSINNTHKSSACAHVLFVGGELGIHHFMVGETKTGAIMLILSLSSISIFIFSLIRKFKFFFLFIICDVGCSSNLDEY
ncbi:NINE protein [Bartonella sp. cb54]|uniref:NINE protein n=1 Tax=Bartonella sp. cb54 TaxID=3385560 RepID=UPI0039A7646D